MAFIIYKKTNSRGIEIRLYYLVRNYRDNGKIKRVTIFKLGKYQNLIKALEGVNSQDDLVRRKKDEFEGRLKKIMNGDSTAFIKFCPAWKQQIRMKDLIEKYANELTKINEEKSEIINFIELYPNCSGVQK